MKLSIHGARLIDPASGLDRISDIHIDNGRIAALGTPRPASTPNSRYRPTA